MEQQFAGTWWANDPVQTPGLCALIAASDQRCRGEQPLLSLPAVVPALVLQASTSEAEVTAREFLKGRNAPHFPHFSLFPLCELDIKN